MREARAREFGGRRASVLYDTRVKHPLCERGCLIRHQVLVHQRAHRQGLPCHRSLILNRRDDPFEGSRGAILPALLGELRLGSGLVVTRPAERVDGWLDELCSGDQSVEYLDG